MPKILITGNGFDLNIGLPTAYSDFINILKIIENSKTIDFDIVYCNCVQYQQIKKNYNEFNFDSKKIELLKSLIKNNTWYTFFKNEYTIETWIDFENKIEYVLTLLLDSINYFENDVFSKGPIRSSNVIFPISLLNNNIKIIEVLKAFGIASDIMHDRININTDFLINKYNCFTDIDIEKITNKLSQELENFKLMFNYYFEIFVFPLYDNLKIDIDKSLFSDISYHYTFNYTPTFEKLYGQTTVTKYLHGKINTTFSEIVLGISEFKTSDRVKKKHFLQFTKYFQKLNNNTDYTFINDLENKKYHSYVFFFWGHSLDRSDEEYINEVFDFVNQSKVSSKKIVIVYHDEKSKSKLLLNLLDIRGNNDIQSLMKKGILVFHQNNSIELKTEFSRPNRQNVTFL